MVLRRLLGFELQTKHFGPRRGGLRMNSRDLHIFAASRPREMSHGSAIEPVATCLFECARHSVIFHARRDMYHRSAVLNLHGPEHHISQFAPGRQIFGGDRSHPVLDLPLQIIGRAKCRNDMKCADLVQKRLFVAFAVRR